MSIANKAMLSRLSISQWTGKKIDRKASEEMCETKKVTTNWAKAEKYLVAEEELKKIQKKATAAREFHYKNTLPWDNYGGKLLPAKNYFNYMEKMRQKRNDFENSADKFYEEYPVFIEEAKNHLGDLFNIKDYPTQEEIGSKFMFNIEIYSVPESGDFRVDISTEETEIIRNSIEAAERERLAIAMREPWLRIQDALNKMIERLYNDGAFFKNTLIGNIRDLCEVLPKLNFMDDPNLDVITKEISSKLGVLDPENLRQSVQIRKNAVQTAQEIMDKMEGYMIYKGL